MRYQGLGRGLGSLIPSKTDQEVATPAALTSERQEGFNADKKEVSEVPLAKIESNPMQPRRDFNHQDLEDLINSIKEHGIIQPLVVSRIGDRYQLIAGERRFRAAQILSLEKVPVVIRQTDKKQDLLELALIENIQRKDLNPIEKANGYQQLMNEFNLTQEEAAKKMGKNRATVANALRLLELPEEIKMALTEERITEGHAKAILAIDAPDQQLKLFRKILENKFSVRETERSIRVLRGKEVSPIVKDLEIKEKEERLRETIGTKVTINKKGQKGKIIIEFYSPEELKSIVDKICS